MTWRVFRISVILFGVATLFPTRSELGNDASVAIAQSTMGR
jgi:hypothetical protein